MCDMSQFVVVIPVPAESSTTLPGYFFQYVLMKFGMCHLILTMTAPHSKVLLLLCTKPLILIIIHLLIVIIRDYQLNIYVASLINQQ